MTSRVHANALAGYSGLAASGVIIQAIDPLQLAR